MILKSGEQMMSMIPCTEPCEYQSDGVCTLNQAPSNVLVVPNDRCLNFTPRSDQHGDGLPDIADPDKL